jgi:hypothetical protein
MTLAAQDTHNLLVEFVCFDEGTAQIYEETHQQQWP